MNLPLMMGKLMAKGTQIDWKPLALAVYRLIIKLSNQKSEELIKSLSGFSSTLAENGFTEEALFLMRKRTELSPRNPQLWIELDSFLEALERYEEAE